MQLEPLRRCADAERPGWVTTLERGNHLKMRHFGMDAEIQAKDGNLKFQQCLIEVQSYSIDCLPWTLDFGIHAEMTGLSILVYTEEKWIF
jgi:hypothetical protein